MSLIHISYLWSGVGWNDGAYESRFSVFKYEYPQFWNLDRVTHKNLFTIDTGLEFLTPAPTGGAGDKYEVWSHAFEGFTRVFILLFIHSFTVTN